MTDLITQPHPNGTTSCGRRSMIHLAVLTPRAAASVDAEPVAYAHYHKGQAPNGELSPTRLQDADKRKGWTEIPLYTEAQMQARADAARRDVLEEAMRELARSLVLNVENWPTEYFSGFDDARSAVAALKDAT